MDIQYWIDSFMSDTGQEHHLSLIKNICQHKNMRLPLTEIEIKNQLNFIYLREMYDWLNSFQSKYGSEIHLDHAERYAKLAEVNIPLSDFKKNIILKSIYTKKMEKLLDMFFSENGKLEDYYIACDYANKANMDIPIDRYLINNQIKKLKLKLYNEIKENFMLYYPQYIYILSDLVEYDNISLKSLFIENLSRSFISKEKDFNHVYFLINKIGIFNNLPVDIIKHIYEY